MKQWTGLFAALLLAPAAFAQDDKISTDRPSETQNASLVPKRYLQLESGIQKEGNGPDYTLFHPVATVRYGLSKKLELRAEVDSDTERDFSHHQSKYGLLPLQLGFKAALAEARGALPQTTLYTMVGLPRAASKDNKVAHVFPMVRLLMQNKLTNDLELAYNAGAEWQGEESSPQWLVSINPQLSLGQKWSLFAEAYSKWQHGHGPENAVDAGFAFLIGKTLQWDVIAGKGLSHEAPEYFIGTGISVRLKM